jgi:hypothetical protein
VPVLEKHVFIVGFAEAQAAVGKDRSLHWGGQVGWDAHPDHLNE